jgi:hypothetical protein
MLAASAARLSAPLKSVLLRYRGAAPQSGKTTSTFRKLLPTFRVEIDIHAQSRGHYTRECHWLFSRERLARAR